MARGRKKREVTDDNTSETTKTAEAVGAVPNSEPPAATAAKTKNGVVPWVVELGPFVKCIQQCALVLKKSGCSDVFQSLHFTSDGWVTAFDGELVVTAHTGLRGLSAVVPGIAFVRLLDSFTADTAEIAVNKDHMTLKIGRNMSKVPAGKTSVVRNQICPQWDLDGTSTKADFTDDWVRGLKAVLFSAVDMLVTGGQNGVVVMWGPDGVTLAASSGDSYTRYLIGDSVPTSPELITVAITNQAARVLIKLAEARKFSDMGTVYLTARGLAVKFAGECTVFVPGDAYQKSTKYVLSIDKDRYQPVVDAKFEFITDELKEALQRAAIVLDGTNAQNAELKVAGRNLVIDAQNVIASSESLNLVNQGFVAKRHTLSPTTLLKSFDGASQVYYGEDMLVIGSERRVGSEHQLVRILAG